MSRYRPLWSVWFAIAICASWGTVAVVPTRAASPQAAKDRDQPVAAQSLLTHLQNINARMYGAYWCPHCAAQRELFGANTALIEAGIYVECAEGGPNRATPWLCDWHQIRAYPTWIINGERYEGVQSLEQLATLSGFDHRAP